MVSSLEKLVAEVLGMPEDEVDDATGAATTGAWTSLRHVRIIDAVGRAFDVSVSPREARSCRSVGDLRKLLAEKGRSV